MKKGNFDWNGLIASMGESMDKANRSQSVANIEPEGEEFGFKLTLEIYSTRAPDEKNDDSG